MLKPEVIALIKEDHLLRRELEQLYGWKNTASLLRALKNNDTRLSWSDSLELISSFLNIPSQQLTIEEVTV